MINQVFETRDRGDTMGLPDLVAQTGSAAHVHVVHLSARDVSAAALADAVHLLCLLHGRYPGVMGAASDRVPHAAARDWMDAAATGFAVERNYVTRLVVAAGPIPSTPRQSQSQSAVIGQANALDVLARSERRGTALGAALALALDWVAVRPVLDCAARRFDFEVPVVRMPDPREGAAIAALAGDTPAVARALEFGTRQLLVQHRGLWDLLESREAARG